MKRERHPKITPLRAFELALGFARVDGTTRNLSPTGRDAYEAFCSHVRNALTRRRRR
jgi:hypothetical protein